jgi:hypothetical protein
MLFPSLTYALGGASAYVGVSAGQATLIRQSAPDETATGYKIFGGLHVTGPFLVEVSHVNLGKYYNNVVEVSGNALHLVGKLPFTPAIYALAKVGLFSWDVQNTSSNSSTTGSDTSYGFALAYMMPIGYTVRVEWEQYSDVGKVNSVSGNDMTLLSVGISLQF